MGEKTQPRREGYFTHGYKRQMESISQVWLGKKKPQQQKPNNRKKKIVSLECLDHSQVAMLGVEIALYKLTLHFMWPYGTAVQKNRSVSGYPIKNPHQFEDLEN